MKSEEVKKLFEQYNALLHGHFLLSSGLHSDTYFQSALVLQYPHEAEKLAEALVPERDLQFGYLGLQTLYDRYFLHIRDVRIEMPQAFYMRVAMGLALNEIDREARAIEFYNLLSSFDFMSSTPTRP